MMKEIKLTIPNTWSDVTIGVYQKYIEIQENEKKEKNKIIKSVALLCNTTEEIVKKMEYKSLLEITQIISVLVDSEPSKLDFKKKFMFEGDKYGFIPDLSKLTTGEYIDLENYTKNPIENLHTIMSILYRKITFERGNRYAIENYDPNKFKEELFKDCPMNIALSSLGFFLTLGQKLAEISHNYLKKQNRKKLKITT